MRNQLTMTNAAIERRDLKGIRLRAEAWLTTLEGSNTIPPGSPSHLPAGFLTYYRDVILPDIYTLIREVARHV